MKHFSAHAFAVIMTAIRDACEVSLLHRLAAHDFAIDRLARIEQSTLREMITAPHAAAAFFADAPSFIELLGEGEIVGGVNPGDRRALYSLVLGLEPRRILEIGTHVGASTIHLARALHRTGRVEERSLVTVDIANVNATDGPWAKAGLSSSPYEMIAALGCAEIVSFEPHDSLAFLAEPGPDFDLIFLDGRHDAAQVYIETSLALRRLSSEGTIVLHDFYPGRQAHFPGTSPVVGPYRALERIRREQPSLRVLPLGDLPWQTKRGGFATSLALVTRR